LDFAEYKRKKDQFRLHQFKFHRSEMKQVIVALLVLAAAAAPALAGNWFKYF